MNIIYQEESQRSKGSLIVLSVLTLALLGFFVYSLARSLQMGQVLWIEFLAEIVVAFILLKQKVGHYSYQLREDALVIEETALFRKRYFTVAYDMIDGLYAFNPDHLSKLPLTYKDRKASSSDDRSLSAILYARQEGQHLVHGRVLVKVSPAFCQQLEAFVPQRVGRSQAVVEKYGQARLVAQQKGISIEEALNPLYQGEEE